MSPTRLSLAAMATVAALATGALTLTAAPSTAADTEVAVPGTAAEHSAEAAKYEKEATELDAKAEQHEKLSAAYAGRATGGSKQQGSLRSLSKHCKSLAMAYREAADEAREMAKAHRAMGGG